MSDTQAGLATDVPHFSVTRRAARVATPSRGTHLHLWLVRIDRSQAAARFTPFVLSAEEEARADRFARPDLRAQFRLARAVTRRILGRACRLRPDAIRFATGTHGKPHLADVPALAFNASHSQDRLLVGLLDTRGTGSLRHGLGVDIEAVRNLPGALDIAERVFAPREVAALAQLSGAARQAQFFRDWVAWEARLKACGLGIAAAERAGLLRTRDDGLAQGLLDAGSGYAAAWASQTPVTAVSVHACVAALDGEGCALAFDAGPARPIPVPSAAWRLQ